MKLQKFAVTTLLFACAMTLGCPQPAANNGGDGDAHGGEENGHAHAHEGDDALVWEREGLEHEGYLISLGHHGTTLFAAHHAEPAVMVTKDGADVADAKVFVTLLDASGGKVITEEQATVFEPKTDDEPAHYAQAEVELPADATEGTLRYRIELPGASEFSQDVPIAIEKH